MAELEVKDANGNELQDGDTVTLIKDLKVKGSSQVIKQGTKVAGIRLTEDPVEIDCRINIAGFTLDQMLQPAVPASGDGLPGGLPT